jgi:hypothetical protein
MMPDQSTTSTPLADLAWDVLTTPAPVVAASSPWDREALAARQRRALASATSTLILALSEVDGDMVERGIARDITRRVIAAYLDQMERIR